MNSKTLSISLLVLAEIAGMSLWFTSAAVLPDLLRDAQIAPMAQALLSSGVQAGFVLGALAIAMTGLADRLDPRRAFAASALMAALANLGLLVTEPGSAASILSRIITGACLAGVYPVGMKIAVGWGTKDRGLLVGLLVGALTLGSAMPHLAAFLGGTDWRITVLVTSKCAVLGGALILFTQLGPHHVRAPRFRLDVAKIAWTDRRVRLAYLGYLGHMWELYAMWAWIAVALAVAFEPRLGLESAASAAKLTAFFAIALGAAACVGAGLIADRIGKIDVTIWAMGLSGAAALATAASFNAPVSLLIIFVLIWGASVIADSAQFSAIVADYAPPDAAGSLLTLQTALGFTLTAFTVQAAPLAANALGWPMTFVILALGPAAGIAAMVRLKRIA